MSENRILPESFGISVTDDATYLWGLFNGFTDEFLIQTVHHFFQQINGMEAFFYFMMSKRCLVDNMLSIIQSYQSSLHLIKIISNIVDGWEDFFLHTNYTLGNTDHNELNSYRQTIFQNLIFIISHMGESYFQLLPHYRCRLRDYFLIIQYNDESSDGDDEDEDDGDDGDDGDDEDDEDDEDDGDDGHDEGEEDMSDDDNEGDETEGSVQREGE